MSFKPIIFNAEMVRAILDGRKTQTRRVIKPQPKHGEPFQIVGDKTKDWYNENLHDPTPVFSYRWRCPYGQPGDLLWYKETWRVGAWSEDQHIAVDYKADGFSRREWLPVPDEEQFERLYTQSFNDAKKVGLATDVDGFYQWEPGESPCRWRSSRFMPRWASRITPKVKAVRVERVQDITEEDAIAEGVNGGCLECGGKAPCGCANPSPDHRDAFIYLWNSINEKRGHAWCLNDWAWVVEFEKHEST